MKKAADRDRVVAEAREFCRGKSYSRTGGLQVIEGLCEVIEQLETKSPLTVEGACAMCGSPICPHVLGYIDALHTDVLRVRSIDVSR